LRDHLTTDSSLEAADRIREWLESRLSAAGIDEQSVSHVMLAASEVATNISRHAYGGATTGRIQASLALRPHEVRLTLTHYGEPFDRAACPTPDLDLPHEGGYGIFLVEALMDEVAYDMNRPDGHRVVLIKRLQGQMTGASRYNAPDEPDP